MIRENGPENKISRCNAAEWVGNPHCPCCTVGVKVRDDKSWARRNLDLFGKPWRYMKKKWKKDWLR